MDFKLLFQIESFDVDCVFFWVVFSDFFAFV